jgi:hypothetical protein
MLIWSCNNGITEIQVGLFEEETDRFYIVRQVIVNDDNYVLLDKINRFQSFAAATHFARELVDNSNLYN